MINTIDEALNFLYTKKEKTKRTDLSRIKKAIELLNIKINYKVIHIAGTNGKGSTLHYLKSLFSNIGLHVGTFESPYVTIFNERIMINNRYISNSEIMYFTNILEEFYYKSNLDLTFFELTFLMALMYFESRDIDYLIMESGIGGLLDITNSIPTDYQIITSIGYDHMDVLGSTLNEILIKKLGIVKTKCYTYLEPIFDSTINDYSNKTNTKIINIYNFVTDKTLLENKLHFKFNNVEYILNTSALYQASNASLAISLFTDIIKDISTTDINYFLNMTQNPGRMEVVNNYPLIILDGAHNISAINELKDSIKNLKNNKKLIVVFSSLKGKDYNGMLNILDEVTDRYYFTSFDDSRVQDYKLYETKIPHEYIDISNLEYSKEYIYLFTGSLHFISYLKNNLKKFILNKLT